MNKLKHFAHGECNLFECIELPSTAKRVMLDSSSIIKGLPILADSETQGNYHVIENIDHEQFISFYEDDNGQVYIKADRDFEVRCLNLGRHERMTVPAGIWKKKIAQEFDPFTQLKREVMD